MDGWKFATYLRDTATNLDYADQRFYANTQGRFMSPDPSTPGDPTDPGSWNYYAYVQGDPINFNDPEGLDCTDARLNGWTGISHGTTVGQFLSKDSDLSALSKTLFAETRIASDNDAAMEKAAVAAVIMNRWQFVNGSYDLYAGAAGTRGGMAKVRVNPDWGTADGTLTAVVFAPHEFEPWAAPGVLGIPSLRRLNSALASDELSAECTSLLQSIGTAAGFWSARDDHFLYTSQDNIVFTSFAAAARGNDPSKAYYETWIGRYGSGNVFSGVTLN